MNQPSCAVRLLLACMLILGLLPQNIGLGGTASASANPPADSSDGSVTMAVYQIDDTSHTVTSVVYSNSQGELVSSTLTGRLDVYIHSVDTVSVDDITVDSRFSFTAEQVSASTVALRDFHDTYSTGAFKSLINVNQGSLTKQLFFARLNSSDSLFKFVASDQGTPLMIRSYTLKNSDGISNYSNSDTLVSLSGSLYMFLPDGAYSMQVNATLAGNTSYIRAFRVSQVVGAATEGKLTEISLNSADRSWSAATVKISAVEGAANIDSDQVTRLERSFYPSDGSEPYLFGSENETSILLPSESYSTDYGVPITYYMDSGSVSSYDLVAQINRLVPDTSHYESILAYNSQVQAIPGTMLDWQISTGDLTKIALNYKPAVSNSNPMPYSLSTCLNYSPTTVYSPLVCYPDFWTDDSPSTYSGGYEMSLPIGSSGSAPGLSDVYVPKNFTVNNLFYLISTGDGGSNYASMTFMKSGDEFTNLVKSAANNPAGAAIDVGGKISDIRTEYIADTRTVIAYLVNEAGDRLIRVDNYNYTEGSGIPAIIHYELAENPGASEMKFQLYGMYPQQELSSDVRLENVQIRFLGIERSGAALNYDILAKTASAASPWVTSFPIIVSLAANAQLNVPPDQYVYAVSDTNQVHHFGIDSLGQAAISYLPAGHWQFKTLVANESIGVNFHDFSNVTRSFVQVGKAGADWPVAASGTVVFLPVAVLSRESGYPSPLDIADIATFAKQVGTGTTWDINQDGQSLNKSDLQYLLQSVKHRFQFAN